MINVLGYKLVRASVCDPLPDLLRNFVQSGVQITRDVVIGGINDNSDLIGAPSDFYFHTDGVFWTLPPRWIIIQVLHTDGGGQLEVVDASPFLEELPHGECFFGRDGVGQTAMLVSHDEEESVLRYRENYMNPVPGGLDLNALYTHLRQSLFPLRVDLGCLQRNDCLLLNNWTHLHRRRMFFGNRRIRRIWLGGKQ